MGFGPSFGFVSEEKNKRKPIILGEPFLRNTHIMAMGQNPVPPVNTPGSKMGGAPTPKWFEKHPYLRRPVAMRKKGHPFLVG